VSSFTADYFSKLLKEHKVDPFVSQTLGGALGTLVDRGLSDQEIIDLSVHLLSFIRTAVANPDAAPLMAAFLNLGNHA
jgi:hypothetical protein